MPSSVSLFLNAQLVSATADEIRLIRPLALKLDEDLADSRRVMDFGLPVQNKIAELPDIIIDLMRTGPSNVAQRLVRIREHIADLDADELLAPRPSLSVGDALRRILTPPEALPSVRLNAALRLVEIEVGGVQQSLPGLRDQMTQIATLIEEEEASRRNLEAHIRAGEIILELRRGSGGLSMRSLEDRLTSLRQSRVAALTDAPRLAALQETYSNLVNAAQGVVIDMVGLWKRSCGAVLAVLADPRSTPRAAAAAANALRAARFNAMNAINASVKS